MKHIEKFDEMMKLTEQYEAGEIAAEVAREAFYSMSDGERGIYKMYKRSIELENEQLSIIAPLHFYEEEVEDFDKVARELGIFGIAYTNRSTGDLRVLYKFQQLGWQFQRFEEINVDKDCFGHNSGFEKDIAVIMVRM